MFYFGIAVIIFLLFTLAANRYINKFGKPTISKHALFEPFIALLLILLNFLDWWTTKHVIQTGATNPESSPFLNYLAENSLYMGDVHKLLTGSIIMIILAFALKLDTLLALIFLMASILIVNSIALLSYAF